MISSGLYGHTTKSVNEGELNPDMPCRWGVDHHGMEQIPPEALLDGYPAMIRETAAALRSLVHVAVPDAWERVRLGWHLIGYDLPIRRYGVYFAYVAPELLHVHLGFEWGVFMDDPAHLLQGEAVTKQVRWLTFTSPAEIDPGPTVALVREAARAAALTSDERRAVALDRELPNWDPPLRQHAR